MLSIERNTRGAELTWQKPDLVLIGSNCTLQASPDVIRDEMNNEFIMYIYGNSSMNYPTARFTRLINSPEPSEQAGNANNRLEVHGLQVVREDPVDLGFQEFQAYQDHQEDHQAQADSIHPSQVFHLDLAARVGLGDQAGLEEQTLERFAQVDQANLSVQGYLPVLDPLQDRVDPEVRL